MCRGDSQKVCWKCSRLGSSGATLYRWVLRAPLTSREYARSVMLIPTMAKEKLCRTQDDIEKEQSIQLAVEKPH